MCGHRVLLLQRVYLEHPDFYPPPQMAPKEGKPVVDTPPSHNQKGNIIDNWYLLSAPSYHIQRLPW